MICEVLNETQNVTELDLSQNHIGAGGVAALAEILKPKDSFLKSLSLKATRLGDKEARTLMKSMKNNRQLTLLDLSSNAFSDKAGPPLMEMLNSGVVIKDLDLSWNNLRGKGVAVFAEGLATSVALQ